MPLLTMSLRWRPRLALIFLPLFAALVVQPLRAECEAQVDLADSLDFKRFHSDCDETSPGSEKPVTEKPGTKKHVTREPATKELEAEEPETKPAATVRQPAAARTADADRQDASAGDAGGTAHDIAALFTLSDGQQDAYQQLLQQMAARCPQGWVKEREWVTPAEAGYRLYHRFHCL